MEAKAIERVHSVEEYWKLAEESDLKYEFWDGIIIAMVKGTEAHAVISGNIFSATKNALADKPCKARNSEKAVRIEKNNIELHPDALVFCPPAQLVGPGGSTLLNPKVVFEVLSKSTETKDRGFKFRAYQNIPTLTDYVLVDQYVIRVEHYRRIEGGWLLRTYNALEDALQFPDLGITLPLKFIYEELDLPTELMLVEDDLFIEER